MLTYDPEAGGQGEARLEGRGVHGVDVAQPEPQGHEQQQRPPRLTRTTPTLTTALYRLQTRLLHFTDYQGIVHSHVNTDIVTRVIFTQFPQHLQYKYVNE